MSRTLMIIKPDAVAKNAIGDIIRHVEHDGFRVVDLRMVRQTREQAGAFYAVHKERPFYNDLVAFMTSGPCVPVVLERENAVSHLRKVVGATDPATAEAGTIRKAHGSNVQNNAVHASDSDENAAKEVAFYFSK